MNKYIDDIREGLGQLDDRGRAAFVATCCERMLPFYEHCTGYNWCRPDQIRGSVRRILNHSRGMMIPEVDVPILSDEILESSPNMEESSDYDALDACRVFSFAIQACVPSVSMAMSVSVAEVVIENAGRSSDYEDDDPMYWQTSPVADVLRWLRGVLDLLRRETVVNDGVVRSLTALAQQS